MAYVHWMEPAPRLRRVHAMESSPRSSEARGDVWAHRLNSGRLATIDLEQAGCGRVTGLQRQRRHQC